MTKPEKLRWDWIAIGVAVYVVAGQIVAAIPNPMVPDAVLALNMAVPIITGYLGGSAAGLLVGLLGTLLNFLIKAPFSGLDYFELAAVVPHALMGAAAGWLGKSQSRVGTASTILLGHGANILVFVGSGLLSAGRVLSASFWTGLLAETAVEMILIMLAISALEGVRQRRLASARRPRDPRELLLKAGIVLLPALLLGFCYLKGSAIAYHLFVVPVVLAAVLVGAPEAWCVAVLLSIPLGRQVVRLGAVAATGQVSVILVLNLVALAVGELAGTLQRERMLSRERSAELERAYAVLNEADRLKAQMIQNVSHELRTPLAIVIGYTDLLLEGQMGQLQPEQQETAEIVLEHGHRLALLVDQMTVLYQVEEGRLACEPFHLDLLVHNRVQEFRAGMADSLHQVHLSIEQTDCRVTGDAQHLGYVVDALLRNAVKFSPAGGDVSVRLWVKPNRVCLTVRDQGVGVPPEAQEKLFRRFYQLDGAATRRFGGMGLGLALVKEVVQAHGGDVWVESQPGDGSLFGFWLPLAMGGPDQGDSSPPAHW